MGQTITAERDQANVPIGVTVTRDGGIAGLTILFRLYLGSDLTFFLDFSDGVFKAAGHGTTDLVLDELGFGEYVVDGGFDLSAITVPASDDHLLAVYDISAGGETGSDTDTIQLVENFRRQAFDNWEEILTGAVHNVPTSAGRRLRELGFELESGLAQAGSAKTITLEVSESAIDGFFIEREIGIVDGLGVGQIRTVTAYVGATRIATVHRAWDVDPDLTSQYVLGSARPTLPLAQRLIGFAGQDNVMLDGGPNAADPLVPEYDSAGLMLEGRMRVFDTAANRALATPGNVAVETGELFRQHISATSTTPGRADSYVSDRIL